jgi:hypothetical protein
MFAVDQSCQHTVYSYRACVTSKMGEQVSKRQAGGLILGHGFLKG